MRQSKRTKIGWRGCLVWAGYIFAAGVLLVIAFYGIGNAANRSRRAALTAQFPPPGEMVDVGGHRLHIYCEGQGSPTVLLESGTASVGAGWYKVQPEAAKSARVCYYDRANIGWSDPNSRSHTADVQVNELHTLLHEASIPGPYVLVGHSYGGALAMYYAHQYPEDVVGVVLVDAMYDYQLNRLPNVYTDYLRRFARVFRIVDMTRIIPPASGLGLNKTPASTCDGQVDFNRQLCLALLQLNDYKAALARDFAWLDRSLAIVDEAKITTLGDIPLVVIVHGHCTGCEMMTPQEQDEFEQIWRRLHQEMAELSPRGKLVVAERSGHAVQIDQPELVIQAIEDVVAAAQLSMNK